MFMNLEFLALTLDIVGKVMIAYTALRVHHRFWQEHKIDENVFTAMKKEQVIGILGILFIVAGYLLEASLIL